MSPRDGLDTSGGGGETFSLGHPDSGVVTLLIWTTLTQLVELVLVRLNLEAWYIYIFNDEVEPHYTSLQNGKPVGTHTCAFVCMFACTHILWPGLMHFHGLVTEFVVKCMFIQ